MLSSFILLKLFYVEGVKFVLFILPVIIEQGSISEVGQIWGRISRHKSEIKTELGMSSQRTWVSTFSKFHHPDWRLAFQALLKRASFHSIYLFIITFLQLIVFSQKFTDIQEIKPTYIMLSGISWVPRYQSQKRGHSTNVWHSTVWNSTDAGQYITICNIWIIPAGIDIAYQVLNSSPCMYI